MGLFFQTLRVVVGATIADFLYTPVWWYSRGFWKQLRGTAGSFIRKQHDLAIDVWLKNVFVPMYGQYDIVGRLISFFMRLVQIIGRAIVLLIWAALLVVWLMAWILIPAGIVYFIILQLSS